MPSEKDAQLREFAKRLQKEMVKRGWSQSDLARQADKHMPDGKEFGRHLINYYMRLRGLPTPVYLKALADAFGVAPEELLPQQDHWATREFVGVNMKTIEDSPGEVWLNFNQRLSTAKALKIMGILNE